MNLEFLLQSPEFSYGERHSSSFQWEAGSAESPTPSQVEFAWKRAVTESFQSNVPFFTIMLLGTNSGGGNHHNCSEDSSDLLICEVSSLSHTSRRKILTWLVCLQNCNWNPATSYLCEERRASVDGLQCDPQTCNYARKSTVIKENEL